MADAITFQMTGAAELAAALDKLPDAIETKIVRDMLMLGARDLANDFKVAAPVQAAGQTGGHAPGEGKQAIDVSSSHKDKAPEARVVLRPKGYWLSFYEFGTSHQPARPFMRPALDANTPAILEEMVDLGAQKLDEAVESVK